MENSIQIFNHEKFGSLRTMQMPDGQIGFVGKDVATALGYNNASKAVIMHVDCEDKVELMVYLDSQNGNAGQRRKATIINESGLYALILSSKLPKAREFKHWVTSEVLPSIRKDGGYIVAKADDTPEVIMARAILLADKTIKKQQEKIDMQSKQIADLERKTEYLRLIEATPGYVNINQIAQDHGWSAIRMNRKLHELGIQYFQGGQWILYAKYKDKGYVKSRTVVCEDGEARMHTKWSQRGRRFIYEELRKELILPMCELY